MKQWRLPIAVVVLIAIVSAALLYDTIIATKEHDSNSTDSEKGSPDATERKKSDISQSSDITKGPSSIPKDYKPPYSSHNVIAALVDKRLSSGKRSPPDLVSKLPRVTISKNQKALLVVLNDKSDHPSVRNNVLVLLRRSDYQPQLADHILRQLNDPEETELWREYCVQHLMYAAQDEKDKARRAWIVTKLEEPLTDKSPKVRRAALRALTILDNPKALPFAKKVFLSETEPSYLRQTAIHTIGRFKALQHVPALRKIAKDHKDVELRIAAIAVLGTFQDQESRSIFQSAARSKHHRLKGAGKLALKKIGKK